MGRLYVKVYRNHHILLYRRFGGVYQGLRDTGSLSKECHLSGKTNSVSTPQTAEDILGRMSEQ